MKKSLKVITALSLTFVIAGCSGSNSPAPTADGSTASAASVKTVYIKSSKAAYSADSRIAQNIKQECSLDSKLITFIKEAAQEQGITVNVSDAIPAGATELKVEITDSVSSGNSYIGHRKFTSIAGSLVESGSTVGTFEAARRSGGGMFAQFKGSCAVLGRTVKTLGSDVATWMKNPSNGAALGDVRLIPRR